MALCSLHAVGRRQSLQPCAQRNENSPASITGEPRIGNARSIKRVHIKGHLQRLPHGDHSICTDILSSSSRPFFKRRATSQWSKERSSIRASREDRRSSDGAGKSFEEPFRQAIFELEIMVREPAEVLGGMQERLSARDLELVLTYFGQEGRDSWCALEVYEWMQRENRVGDDTQKLMMSIMFDWVMKLVEREQPVEEVKSLLQDMNCVGLKPEFHIIQSIIAKYWDKGRKAEAIRFVKEILETGVESDGEDPMAFLLVKMVRSGEQKEAFELVRTLRRCGLKLRVSAYSAALLAAIKEQEQFTKVQRQLRTYVSQGTLQELEKCELEAFKTYEDNLHRDAEEIARWAEEEEVPDTMAGIYERLLAMYCIAGKGLDAERALWQMKISGREPPIEMYNTIVGICGFGKHWEAAFRILRRMEDLGPMPVKKTYTVLIGGFLKGGNYQEASETLQQMLKRGLRPDPHVMLAVLRSLQKADLVTQYLHLCKTLAQVGLIEPCLLFFYIDALNLCIIRLL